MRFRSATVALFFCSAVLALLWSLWLARDWLHSQHELLKDAKDAVDVLGVVALAAGALGFFIQQRERLRVNALDRVRLSLELMQRYYDDSAFDELRPSLWSGTQLPRTSLGGLRVDELRFLNYLEGISIAVDEGALDIRIVDRMLGTPIRQLAKHEFLGPFCLNHSYEGVHNLWRRLGIPQPTPRGSAAQAHS